MFSKYFFGDLQKNFQQFQLNSSTLFSLILSITSGISSSHYFNCASYNCMTFDSTIFNAPTISSISNVVDITGYFIIHVKSIGAIEMYNLSLPNTFLVPMK